MWKKISLHPETEALVRYRIYSDKKEELESFIRKEFQLWGSYESMPGYIKKLIDSELVAIGRYGKRIDAYSIEQRIASGEL